MPIHFETILMFVLFLTRKKKKKKELNGAKNFFQKKHPNQFRTTTYCEIVWQIM